MINSINTEKIQSQEINLTKVESSSPTEEIINRSIKHVKRSKKFPRSS